MKKYHKIYTAATIAALLMGTAVAVPQTIIPKSTLTASAATTIRETIDGVTYEFDSTAKTATIVGIDDSKKSFTTPEKVKYNNTNYDVVAIGSYGCANKPNLTDIAFADDAKSPMTKDEFKRSALNDCVKRICDEDKQTYTFEPVNESDLAFLD